MPWHPSDFEGTGAVETFEFIETGRGVRAMKEITPGSTVFSIPKSVIITPTSVLRSSFGEQLLKVLSIKINPTELLTLYVVCHLLHWPCIKWLSNYFKSLPDFTKSTSLLYWTENELSLLPTALKDEALKRKASLKALYSNTNHLFNGAAGLLDYINANDCVESRSVYFDCSLKGLPQLIDNSTVSANVALVPFLDMLNHSSSPSVQPSFDSLTSPSSLQIAAINKLTKNEQLFISYGQHSNEILLQFYGFVLENNPCDVIFIEVDDLAECCAFASSLHDGWIQSNVFVSAQLPSWWLITLLCSKSFDEWFGFREGQVDLPSILEAESHKIIVDLLIKKRRRLVSGLDFDVSISKQKSQLVKSFFATKINVIDNFINFNL